MVLKQCRYLLDGVLEMIDHTTAERLRDMLASCQMSVFLSSDVSDEAKERIINEISVNGFCVIDELEGVVR